MFEYTPEFQLPPAPVPNSRKGSALFHSVRRAILMRELTPGTALVEQQIARRFGCSQGTVREALMRLKAEGLVDRRGYKGTVVSNTGISEATQMAEIRLKLESFGIRYAALAFGAIELDRVRSLVERLEAAQGAGDHYAFGEFDRLLHLTIFRAAKLPTLEPILTRCALHMHRYTFADAPHKASASPLTKHQAIVDALAARDPERAAAAVRTHIAAVIELWAPPLHQAMDPGAGIASAEELRVPAEARRP